MKKIIGAMRHVIEGVIAVWLLTSLVFGVCVGAFMEIAVPGWISKPEKLTSIIETFEKKRKNEKTEKTEACKIGFIK